MIDGNLVTNVGLLMSVSTPTSKLELTVSSLKK